MTALSDFDTLAEAKAFPVESYRDLSKNELIGILKSVGLLRWVVDTAETDDDLLALTLATAFSVDPDNAFGQGNIATLEALATEYSDKAADIEKILPLAQDVAKTTTYPFASATAYAFNAAKGIVSTLQTPYARSLTIELATALEEKAPVTVWAVQDGFADINLGKTTWGQCACKYAITSIPSVPAGYSLELRINMPEVEWSAS